MAIYNIESSSNFDEMYQKGYLPQRNDRFSFYQDSSCRSNLSEYILSSENRRILKKTENFSFEKIKLSEFHYNPTIQKTCKNWIGELGWDFPVSSIKNVFTNHIFNFLYVWKNESGEIIAYALAYVSPTISHIAYVFYNPQYAKSNLPIRLVLEAIIDSHKNGLEFCYLGRFSTEVGFYKRNMPGFEYFDNGKWLKYNKHKH